MAWDAEVTRIYPVAEIEEFDHYYQNQNRAPDSDTSSTPSNPDDSDEAPEAASFLRKRRTTLLSFRRKLTKFADSYALEPPHPKTCRQRLIIAGILTRISKCLKDFRGIWRKIHLLDPALLHCLEIEAIAAHLIQPR